MMLPYADPYKIKMIEPMYPSTRSDREQWITEAHYNLFNLKSQQVFIDLLTDSGTGAMSQEQWSALMSGDESYAGSKSFERLRETITSLTGFPYVLPTHQGRAAENVLFSVMVKEGHVVPGNAHFDTTKGHIEFRKASAFDCTIDAATDTSLYHPFKGNLDIGKLENVVQVYGKERIPLIIVTITCNSTGGQPVSMENLRAVREFADTHGIPVIFDSARFAENAYFIKVREKGYQNRSIREIIREMFSLADGMTMSSKKDGIVNMGGFIAMNSQALFREATTFNIMFEGYITYGGMSGRDMAALAQGLEEATTFGYLESRIKQVHYLGGLLREAGIPVQEPFGGHAIFVDATRFLPKVPCEEFIAQTLAIELYLESGVRAVEIGTLLADRDPDTRENRYPKLELLRLTIPRRVYTRTHMDYVAAALQNVYRRRNKITSGYKIRYEAPIMRHFTVELEKIT
ncbi:MAG: tryptophanase [Bacteroidia bacterium]|nr:MAG: tryptophanase [Bacteroidia bacterium]